MCIYEIKILINSCILLDFVCELYCDTHIHEHQILQIVCGWYCY
jgi:hypothetical protein